MSGDGSDNYWTRRLAPQRPAADSPEGEPAPEATQPVATIAAPAATVPDPRAVPVGPSHAARPDPVGSSQGYHPIEAYRGTDWLLIVRLVSALAILSISVTSYIVATSNNPSAQLQKWGWLQFPTTSRNTYKGEMVALIILAALAVIVFVARFSSAQFLSLLLGLTVMGIVTGNTLALPVHRVISIEPPAYQQVAYAMIQTGFITTWICLGLALMITCSVAWFSATPRQVVGLFAGCAVVTGVTVAIISAIAPTLPVFPFPFPS